MTAVILDGKRVALQLKAELTKRVALAVQHGQRSPGLAVILIGDDPASRLYVATKRKACLEVGLQSFAYNLPFETTQEALLSLIEDLNHQQAVDGILVQLPLPLHMNTSAIIEAIHPDKDVDGFHPYNFGRLAQANPALRPCTPFGVIQLLNAYQIPIKRQKSVIIGASNIVGRPMALELLMAGATVTICHSLTQELDLYVKQADLIISATGVRDVVQIDWLHAKQTVVDIGMHQLEDKRICGDIDFEQAKHRVAAITPVPGGVGPMTVTTLLQNTVQACYDLKSSFQSNSPSNSPS